jgi:hypothetical protein
MRLLRATATAAATPFAVLLSLAPWASALDAPCGNVDGTGGITATDALLALGAAVSGGACEPCRCDVDGDGSMRARDALAILIAAVGGEGSLECPSCDGSTCRFDEASGECRGECAEAASQCVLGEDGGCVCTASVCAQCYITVTDTCEAGVLCSANADCPVPNAFCGGVFYRDCPSVECPCCPTCGDGECEDIEAIECGCAQDCGGTPCTADPPDCGDGFCDQLQSNETFWSCPQDCSLPCRPC